MLCVPGSLAMVLSTAAKVFLLDDHQSTTGVLVRSLVRLLPASVINRTCNEENGIRRRFHGDCFWQSFLNWLARSRVEHDPSDSLKSTGCEAEASGNSSGHVEDKPQLYTINSLKSVARQTYPTRDDKCGCDQLCDL